MKKENIEKLIKAINNNYEEIIETSKECYKNTMDGSCFQGWHVGIMIDTDGNISDFYRSSNSYTFGESDGESIAAVTYTTGNDIPETEYTEDNLNQFEIGNFKKFLLENKYIEADDLKNDEWLNELNYERLEEFDSDIIKRIDAEVIDFEVNEYYRDKAEEKIDMTLIYLNQELANIEDGEYY